MRADIDFVVGSVEGVGLADSVGGAGCLGWRGGAHSMIGAGSEDSVEVEGLVVGSVGGVGSAGSVGGERFGKIDGRFEVDEKGRLVFVLKSVIFFFFVEF